MPKISTQRFRICLSYDGANFFGWQRQLHIEPTLQGVLEKILSQIFNQPIAVIGSGRTDRGVHALNQWAHFDLPLSADISNLAYQLRRMTPEAIRIKSLEKAPVEFHAQISALSKCYKYRLHAQSEKNPFLRHYSWCLGRPVHLSYLNALASLLVGEHDFSSFQSTGTPVRSPVRKIMVSRWVEKKSGIVEYQIQGSGFLKQMVRNLVGAMVKLEQFQDPIDNFREILAAKNRTLIGAPAPPQGLFLSSVQYPKSLDNKCRKL